MCSCRAIAVLSAISTLCCLAIAVPSLRDLCGFKRDLTEFEGTEMKDASQVNCTADWTAADPHSHPPSILDGGSRNSPSGQNADWWIGDAALAAMDVDLG